MYTIFRLFELFTITWLWFTLFVLPLTFIAKKPPLNLRFFYGEIFDIIFCFRGIIDFGKREERVIIPVPYAPWDYLKWFVFDFTTNFFSKWRILKQDAYLYSKPFSVMFSTLILWHAFLLQYIPMATYLHCLYLGLIVTRKTLVLLGNIGGLIIVNPIKLHRYELNLYFKETKNKLVPKLLPMFFSCLLVIIFVFVAVSSVLLCSLRLRDGLVVLF